MGGAAEAGARAFAERGDHRRGAGGAFGGGSAALGGYKVTVYDRHDRAGGLLIYGIPNFKLEKEIVERGAPSGSSEGGVAFRLGVDVGKDISLAELRNKHDARPGGDGCLQVKELGTPGQEAKGVLKALDYLIAANRVGLGLKVPEFESGVAERGRQERRRDRRRRYGDGLRADGGAPGREVGDVPLSPRPGEHAGLAARSGERRGRRREVRLARLPAPCWRRRAASPRR